MWKFRRPGFPVFPWPRCRWIGSKPAPLMPCASESDFLQLRVCQLRDRCRANNLDPRGKKAQLAARLAGHGGFLQDEILALRQTYQNGSGQKEKNTQRKGKVTKRKKTGPKIGEEDFRKLLWLVQDGLLHCSCGKQLRHRNGRFGVFLFCASGHIERLEKAVARMQDRLVSACGHRLLFFSCAGQVQ